MIGEGAAGAGNLAGSVRIHIFGGGGLGKLRGDLQVGGNVLQQEAVDIFCGFNAHAVYHPVSDGCFGTDHDIAGIFKGEGGNRL